MKRPRALLFVLIFLLLAPSGEACTRFLYKGQNNILISARNQDWKEDINAKFWKFPQGMQRSGAAGDHPIQWTSRYGSLIISGYDLGVAEGVNEKGLAVHLLWLANADYGHRKGARTISFGAWAQFVLDNYATTDDAVRGLDKLQLQVIAAKLPTGHTPQVHFSIADATGDSAIVEFIHGKQVIHHSPEYTVMTNEPSYDLQLAIQKYFQETADYKNLPGSSLPIDRFTRVGYYLRTVPPASDTREALAAARSILETVTVPRGYALPDRPNISTTVYRSLFDHNKRVYYYQGTFMPHFFWIDMKKLDFTKETDVMMLDTEKGRRVLAGEVSGLMIKAEPFAYISDR